MSISLPTSHHNTIIITPLSKFDHRKSSKNGLQMAVEGDFDPDALSKSVEEAKAGSIKARLRALYKFTRPHTIRGTILASIAGTTRALIDTPGAITNANWGFMLPRAAIGMVALLMGNAFIVGINQIYDKEIDEMNKPFLPVASGEMSKKFAWGAVLTAVTVGPFSLQLLSITLVQAIHGWLVPLRNILRATHQNQAKPYCCRTDDRNSAWISSKLWCIFCSQGCNWGTFLMVTQGVIHCSLHDCVRICHCNHKRFTRYRR